MSKVENACITFTVYAHPEQQGSSRAFVNKRTGRAIITSDNKDLKSYRQQVTLCAMTERNRTGFQMIEGPSAVGLDIDFFFRRPKSAKKRAVHTVKPDLDKLVRAVNDSLSGFLYGDDSQVTTLMARKLYVIDGEPEYTLVQVWRL